MKRTNGRLDAEKNISRCQHSDHPCDDPAWSFWKAQSHLVMMNLRLAHLKKQLRQQTASQEKGEADDQPR